MTQPAETKTIGDWLVDFYESLFTSGGQVNASAISINPEAANAGYDPAQLAGVDASAAYYEACQRPGVPAHYSSAPPPPPYSSPQEIVQHITQVSNVQQNFT